MSATVHGETGVSVLGTESQLALEHAGEPTAVVLARYREILLAPFDELRKDYESLGDARVARHLDELLRAARGVPRHVQRAYERPVLRDGLSDEERAAIAEALSGKKT